MIRPWLKFFRIVNLPTVPGDVLVGVAAVIAAGGRLLESFGPRPLAAAVGASCALYLFGMADNDLVGANTDRNRPIPDGEISRSAAVFARGLCILAAIGFGLWGGLPSAWWTDAFVLACLVVCYNRTKISVFMGLCRGMNVLLGASVCCVPGVHLPTILAVAGAVTLWTVYIGLLTRYSSGEESDPAKKRFVGFLIGALVYLQLLVLLVCYVVKPSVPTRNLLVAGALTLVLLRILKRAFPKVSAS